MITLALIGAFSMFIGFRLFSRPHNFPPGPKGLPFLGCLLSVSTWHPSELCFLGLIELCKQYGTVVGFYIGPQPVISICGYDSCKEAFSNENLNGRPDNGPAKMKSKGKRMGIMLVDGEFWSTQRRFTLFHLREFGLGRKNMETLLREEIDILLSDMKRRLVLDSNIVEFKNYFNISLVNALWQMLANTRFDRDDARLKALVDLFDFVGRSGNIVSVAFPCPMSLLKLFSSLCPKLGRMDLLKEVWKFIQETIDCHKRDWSSQPRDFIDVYLHEVAKNGNDSFTEEQLMNIILDVLSAGADTTSNSIGFALLHLIHNPEIQTMMQRELDEVCGDSLPALHHKPQLVYTQAVLMEVQRISGVAPLAIPRRCMKATTIKDYMIPQNAYVVINMHSIHMDNKYWEEPTLFRPERHIDKNGCVIQSDKLMPFGAGKRSCLGESLARASFFLFTAALIKTFVFRPIPDVESLPSLTPLDGFTLAHRPFQAYLVPRNKLN